MPEGDADGGLESQGAGAIAPVVTGVNRFIRAIPNPDRFATAGLIAVVGVFGMALSLGLEGFEPHHTLAVVGMALVSLLFIAFVWIRAKAMTSVDAAPRADAPAADERAFTDQLNFEEPEPLGRGDFTEAVRYFDPALERHVVKKVPNEPALYRDFIEGSRKATELSNLPNYIAIYGANFDRVGGPSGAAPYLVMQYLAHGNLREYIDKQGSVALSLEYVRRVVYRVGTGVAAAHRGGIALGNIKASNILLDDKDEPYLSPRTHRTFINPAALRDALLSQRVTLEDLVYTAPELFHPDLKQPAQPSKCDQYALGVLAYHLLTSELPPTLPTVTSGPVAGRVEQTCKLLLEQGSAAFLRLPPAVEWRPDVPMRISAILEKLTALDPAERFDDIDKALANLHEAEQMILLVARDSYTRCVARERTPSFFEQFYARFVRHEAVAARFSGFTGPRWTAQHGRLRSALEGCFDFAKLAVVTVDIAEPNAMSQLARMHGPGGMAISDAEFEHFVEALVETVGGDDGQPPYDPQCEDPRRREEILRAWRELMKPVVRYFQRAS